MREDFPFMMFCVEQEGMLDTRESKICAFLKNVEQSWNPRDPETHAAVANAVGLDLDDLTGQELARIARAIDNM